MTHHQCGEMVETLKSKSFQGARKKKLTTKSCTVRAVPPIFFCLRRHFSFFALQKRVRWKLDFYTVLKIFCLRRHLYYFLLRKKEKCNASPFIGGSTGSTGYRTPESTSLACTRLPRGSVYAGTKSLPHPNNIPNVFGGPLAFCSQKCNYTKAAKSSARV